MNKIPENDVEIMREMKRSSCLSIAQISRKMGYSADAVTRYTDDVDREIEIMTKTHFIEIMKSDVVNEEVVIIFKGKPIGTYKPVEK